MNFFLFQDVTIFEMNFNGLTELTSCPANLISIEIDLGKRAQAKDFFLFNTLYFIHSINTQ